MRPRKLVSMAAIYEYLNRANHVSDKHIKWRTLKMFKLYLDSVLLT
jgi:hypothetical protein